MFIHQHRLLISRSCHSCCTHHPCFHLTTQGASGLDGKPGPRVSPLSFCVPLGCRLHVLPSGSASHIHTRHEGRKVKRRRCFPRCIREGFEQTLRAVSVGRRVTFSVEGALNIKKQFGFDFWLDNCLGWGAYFPKFRDLVYTGKHTC